MDIDGKPIIFAIVDLGGGRFAFSHPAGIPKMYILMLVASQLEDFRLQAHLEHQAGGPPLVQGVNGAIKRA